VRATCLNQNRNIEVSVETRLRERVTAVLFLGGGGPKMGIFVSSPQLPDRIWGPPSLPSNGYPCGKAAVACSWLLTSI